MGKPKQLLPWHGTTLINHVIDTIEESIIEDLIIVLGYNHQVIKKQVREWPAVVINNAWKSGKSASVKCGLGMIPEETDCVVYFTIDQPFITVSLIEQLVYAAGRTDAAIIACRCKEIPTVPMLFKRDAFEHIRALKGEEGGKSLLALPNLPVSFVEILDERILLDIDTEEDYQKALAVDQFHN